MECADDYVVAPSVRVDSQRTKKGEKKIEATRRDTALILKADGKGGGRGKQEGGRVKNLCCQEGDGRKDPKRKMGFVFGEA